MKITTLLSKLITEQSRFQVLYDKMVKPQGKIEPGERKPKGLMDFETLKAIILADPTTRVPENKDIDELTLEDMENVKVGKFTQWLLKNFVAVKPSQLELPGDIDPKSREYQTVLKEYQRLFLEDLYKVTDDLKKYERFKSQFPQDKRDINKLSVRDLYELTKDLSLDKTKATKTEKEIAKTSYKYPGSEIIFRGNKWTVIKIEDKGELGKGAAIFFGGYQDGGSGESRWCTSAPGLNYFNTYIKDGPLYVILPNDDKGEIGKRTGLPKERYQFHFPTSQFMDREDHQIKLVEYLNGPMSEIKEIFKSEFAKGLVQKGGDKADIIYPDGSSGKFVALYGFNDLFASLPENIKQLLINNKSNENISLVIPESITRFKNLEALLVNNAVKSIPESISELKNLMFLILTDNKDLEKLPESLSKLPNLSFFRLTGSPKVKIPESFKKRLEPDSESPGYYIVN